MRLTILCCCLTIAAFGQKLAIPHPAPGELLPGWAQEMYAGHANVFQIDDAYRLWRQNHPDVKTTYTQYYKKWRRAVSPFVQADGAVIRPSDTENQAFYDKLAGLKQPSPDFSAANWVNIGPVETFNTNTGPDPLAKSEQANIYCIDQSLSNPDIVYCGTEGSEIFKSTDRGLNWFCVSRTYDISTPTALEVHPNNPDIVFVGEGSHLRKSTDGGLTWEIVLNYNDLWPNEILINPADPQIILAATFKGLFRSVDGGAQWAQLFPEACYDVEWKTDDPNTAFLLRNDPAAKICRLYKSADAGFQWTLKDNGWFFSDEPGVNDGGARLAVTAADPNRVYAVLIGEAREGDAGFIGIYRSNDAGESWPLPNPPAGGPWNDTNHPNMATIGRTGGYHQGFTT